MKTLPRKSAENSQLLGSWTTEGLCVKVHHTRRRAWHKARRQGKLGEQMDRKFEQGTRRAAKAAAARMKA